MQRFIALAVATVVTMGLSAARAQETYYGGGGTVYGSAAHGFADVVRSAGAYNLMTSQAFKNYEDARQKNIENRLLWTQTRLEMRRLNDEIRRAQYERDKSTAEQLAQRARDAAPKRLTSSELDPIEGYVAWPRLLSTPEFADLRRTLDGLFQQRATTKAAVGNDAYLLIRHRVDEMRGRLQKLITAVPPDDYMDARRFLESLAYEARFTAG